MGGPAVANRPPSTPELMDANHMAAGCDGLRSPELYFCAMSSTAHSTMTTPSAMRRPFSVLPSSQFSSAQPMPTPTTLSTSMGLSTVQSGENGWCRK